MRLTYALIFHKMGVPVLPCYGRSKAFKQGFGPYRDRVESPYFLYDWIKENNNNYALATGHQGLLVLDFDNPEIYKLWASDAGVLAETFTVSTGRGYHVYFKSKDLRSWKTEGVDILGRGKAVIGPYCLHPEGEIYKPLTPFSIRSINTVADFPLLSKRPELSEPPEIPPGRLNRGYQGKDTIAEIKSSLPLIDVLAELYPETYRSLKGSDKWRSGLCPFHKDNNPSFWVNLDRDIFGCHACGVHGDVINLYALTLGVSNSEAIAELSRSGLKAVRGVKT